MFLSKEMHTIQFWFTTLLSINCCSHCLSEKEDERQGRRERSSEDKWGKRESWRSGEAKARVYWKEKESEVETQRVSCW